jgi:hypothetical protein
MQNVANTIANALNTRSVTFAGIDYTVDVPTAAANKHRAVRKTVAANVQLFSNIKQATAVFANAVKKTAQALPNQQSNIDAFQQQSNYFEHTACYSIVKHRKNEKLYLYCIYNSTSSVDYTIDGVPATVQQVAELLTPSAAKKLLSNDSTTHNKTYDVTHDVTVRTIALHNLTAMRVEGKSITF